MIKKIDCVNIEHNFFVYSLSDPRNGLVKYIGITKNPKERLRKHLSQKNVTLKNNWVKSLLSNGVTPIMTLVDSSIDRESINEKEKQWIIKYREWGCDLKNMTNGGDGGDTFSGKHHTEEAKNKISLANKGRKRDLSYLTEKKTKKVQQICPITKKVINVFNSVVDAYRITGVSKTNISKFACGKLKSTVKMVGGYEWRYCN